MQTRPIAGFLRLALFLFLVLLSSGPVFAGEAAENAPGVASGTFWSTDLNASGATGLADLAIFVCHYLQLSCPCQYTRCAPSPPAPSCNSGCPLVFPPCDCTSGVPASKSNFDCDTIVGLGDFAIFAEAYLSTTRTGKCN